MNSNQIFKNVVDEIYWQNPYQGFENIHPSNLRKINGKLFDILIKLIRPQIVLELGSWKGERAIKMAQILEKNNLEDSVIICVDTWLGSPENWLDKENKEKGFESLKIEHGFPRIYQTFLSNVINSHQQDKIIPLPQTPENAAVIFRKLNLKFDLIYLNNSKEYEVVSGELEDYWQLLNPQGVILGSGYPIWKGVNKALNEFAEKNKLKLYSKGGKYILLKPEQNLLGLETIGLKEEVVNPEKSENEIRELGLKARQQGKEEEALEYFEQLIRAYPHKVSGYLEAGRSLRALQRLEEAKERFEQALEHNPRVLGALMNLGQITALEWELEDAIKNFKKVIEYHPNYLIAYEQAAIQLRNLKRFTDAEKIADLGLSKIKDERQSFALLKEKAFALVGQLRLEGANEILIKLAKIRKDISLFTQAATLLTSQKKFTEAIKLLDENILLLREIKFNWIGIYRAKSAILNTQRIYENLLEVTKKDENYQLLELRPQKVVLNFSLNRFNLEKINKKKPSVFSNKHNIDSSENLNKGFEDLGGILDNEKLVLCSNSSFKYPIYSYTENQVFTVPNTYIRASNIETNFFSLDGYYLSEFGSKRYTIVHSEKKLLSIAFIVYSTASGNYYHVMVDIIPSLLVYKNLGLSCPIIFPSIPQDIQNVFLDNLNIVPENIMSYNDSNNTLLEMGIFSSRISLDRDIVAFYQNVADKILSSKTLNIIPSKKIYISRRRTSKRPLLNEEEVENLLISLGFYICYMEDYSFAEQIAIMRNCTIVVAPHGAGITNILFCHPGVTVIELLTDKYPESCFFRMSVLCCHKYYPILGSLRKEKYLQDDHDFYQNFCWEIDITKLQRVLGMVMPQDF